MSNVIELDTREAWKRSRKTQRSYAAAIHISPHTLKKMLYAGHLTSLPTAYSMVFASGEVRLHGPQGTVVMRPEKHPTPPGAPAAPVPRVAA